MQLQFSLNKVTNGRYYVGYAPVQCAIKIIDEKAGPNPVTLVLSNLDVTQGGQLVFYKDRTAPEQDTLTLSVADDERKATFYIGGKFKKASNVDGDAAITFSLNGQVIDTINLMVRVRKNANELNPEERDLFLRTFVDFVKSGKYGRFLDMHGEAADGEIHGRASFLPWHRMFLLDLERSLQEINPAVTLPYWDFQKKAENVFHPDFMGISDHGTVGQLQFGDLNPLNEWRIGTLPKLARVPHPRFDTAHDKALVEDKEQTLGRGPGFDMFCLMEGDPHGYAHTSFIAPSPLRRPGTAPQDPLFFMLHANVDRLWAEWQMTDTTNLLFDGTKLKAYNPQTQLHTIFDVPPIIPRTGDFINDTMWPWNGIKGDGTEANPRPTITAPSGPLIPSKFSAFPGEKPTVLDTIDYQGRLTGKSLYFDYFTVPFNNSAASNLKAKILKSDALMADSLNTFKLAIEHVDKVQSLSQLNMLTDKQSTDKAILILKDQQADTGSRVLALSKLVGAVSSDESLILYIIDLLANSITPTDLRIEALRTLETISFSSPIISALNPQLTDVLTGLIRDNNPQIRQAAISHLAQSKNGFVQQELIKGLIKPEEALVSEELAVHLLGYDMHAGIYPILREIVRKSSNNNSRSEAVYLLGGDPDAKGLLSEVFNNKKERFNIRKNSLLSLKQLDPSHFIELARQIINDHNENENIRAVTINLIDQKTLQSLNTGNDFLNDLRKLEQTKLPENLATGIKSFLKNQSAGDLK
ncbi:tyrosinase family protein [Chitinophaga sancti]|uniref:tyrosinase family protein n=1 Tax=Chitinophaga sancti TaxID=1004 RepID=UPI002A750D6D|nr:tyrosinase family protein [Chitinophaga sancti]WPQ61240.1 tyrosinase family protein [Chitinophaga sancti]